MWYILISTISNGRKIRPKIFFSPKSFYTKKLDCYYPFDILTTNFAYKLYIWLLLQDNNRKKDPASVAKVKELYHTLNLQVSYCCLSPHVFVYRKTTHVSLTPFVGYCIGCVQRLWEGDSWGVNYINRILPKQSTTSSVEIFLGKDI